MLLMENANTPLATNIVKVAQSLSKLFYGTMSIIKRLNIKKKPPYPTVVIVIVAQYIDMLYLVRLSESSRW